MRRSLPPQASATAIVTAFGPTSFSQKAGVTVEKTLTSERPPLEAEESVSENSQFLFEVAKEPQSQHEGIKMAAGGCFCYCYCTRGN
jgi:hypothetical protein